MVVRQQSEPLFGAQPEILQRAAEPAGSLLQFAVAQRAIRIGECYFPAETARHLGIDQVRHSIVGPAL